MPLPIWWAPSSGADVDLTVEIGFESTPGTSLAATVWTDVSEYVRAVQIARGRQHELDRVEAGTLSVTLDNADGRFYPDNPDSPYWPNVKTKRRIRVWVHRAGVTYYRFTGFVERWPVAWERPGYAETTVTAVDAFAALAARQIVSDIATLTTALAGSNNDLVYTAREPGGGGDQITVTYLVAGNNTPLTTEVPEPVTGRYVGKAQRPTGVLGGPGQEQQPLNVTLQGTDIVVNVATNGSGAATSTAAQIKTALEANTDVMKLVSIALAAGNDGSGVVTALAKTALSGGRWPAELAGTRISRLLDLISWPAADRDLDVGVATVVAKGFGPSENARALSHSQDCADSDLGLLFADGQGRIVFHDRSHRATDPRSTTAQATWTDDETGQNYTDIEPAYDTDRLVNKATVTAEGGVPQTVEDTASIDEYDEAALTRQSMTDSDTDALSQATAIVDAYKDVFTRFDAAELAVSRTGGSATEVAQTLGREISDRVTVRAQPPGTSVVIAYDCFVEGIQDRISADDPWWRTRFLLSPTGSSTSSDPGGGGGGGGGSSGPLLDSSGDDLVLDSGTAGILG